MNLKSIYIAGILLALFMGSNNTWGQTNIVKAEYFINEDPGFGLGLPIDIGAGTTPSFDVNFTAVTDTLSPGYHFIYIRSQDELGVWSYLEGRSFYVIEPTTVINPVTPKIVGVEYFINDDPGQGLAIYFDATDDFTIDIPSLIAQTDTLSAGYHIIGTRAKTEYGNWGWYERRSFYVTTTGAVVVPTVQKIVDVEYYFDLDPGQGQATSLGPYTPNLTFDLNELIPTSLTAGYHTFNVRSQDENGHWGFVEQRPVYVISAGSTTSITDINKIEYFFDGDDPGVGNATNLPLSTPGQVVELNPGDFPTPPSLIDGQHVLTVRARNGNGWGMADTLMFDVLDDCTQPIAAFTPQLACAGQPVIFINNSVNTDSSARYRWYLDGDNSIDNTTKDSVSFTYPNPGTYVVSLAIRQGTICIDSISNVFTIKPLPAVVFSSTGTTTNQATTFEASTVNLDPAATWSWDFDSNGAPESTNPNTATYTYTADGSYTTTLTVSDGLGCEVTTTKSITVGSGGGTAIPQANFLANSGCVGSTITFTDLSRDLPVGATYSWDFDGDSVEEATVVGSTIHSYDTAGSYSAKLTIDLGGSTIEKTQIIEIVDVPIADFSAVDVCEGMITNFADLSTNTESTAEYMWDFDNDGAVDNISKTGVAYTFTNAGSHIVSLTISNGFGCTNTVIKQVNVIGLPSPDFDWDKVCTGETISFNDLSTGTDTTSIYSWDYGDGTQIDSIAGDITHSFLSKGVYSTSLLISNTGCANTISKTIEIFDRPEVAIDINAKCYGQVSDMIDLSQKVSSNSIYSWDFDNDNVEDDNTVGSTSHTYPSYSSYLVTLNIDNGGGCSSSAEELVVFSDAATPDFIVNKTCQGEEVVFTDLSTNLETGALYSWDFNSDNIEDAATPGSTAHTFNSAGTFNATLTIDNGGQCLAYKTIALDVSPPPAVDLGADLQLCTAGTLTFDAGTGYTSYLWPDGSGLQTYTVDQIGSYMVRVQDAKGCINYDTISVELMGAPVPSFNHSIELSLEGIKVSFENTSTNAESYQWSLGDGTTSSDAEPTHIYSNFSFYETSIYTVCLTANNACEEAQFCEDIFVSPTQLMQEGVDEIQFYPNPASQVVYVELNQLSQSASQLALVDVQGKSLWQSNNLSGRQEINVSEFNRGIYYLVLETETGFLYKKLMKN